MSLIEQMIRQDTEREDWSELALAWVDWYFESLEVCYSFFFVYPVQHWLESLSQRE